MDILIKIIVGYLLGSVSGSLVIGKITGVDIRKSGSGNAGGTNAFRTQGITFALGVVLIDVLKGYASAAFVPYIPLGFTGSADSDLLQILCGGAAVLGHVYPVYFGFKGGKGAGSAIGMIAAISPLLVPIALCVWGIVLIFTGYVGLATMLTALSIPIFGWIIGVTNPYFLPFATLFSLFIIFTHRANLIRHLQGRENRFEKAMLFKKRH